MNRALCVLSAASTAIAATHVHAAVTRNRLATNALSTTGLEANMETAELLPALTVGQDEADIYTVVTVFVSP